MRAQAASDIRELIDELREAAETDASLMTAQNEPLASIIPVPEWSAPDMIEWEAASLLERWLEALQAIAAGCDAPSRVAEAALDWKPSGPIAAANPPV